MIDKVLNLYLIVNQEKELNLIINHKSNNNTIEINSFD